MKIASQCLPGGHNHYDYTPQHPWDSDTYVQWGGNGMVVKSLKKTLEYGDLSEGNILYRTAFFEAFPRDPKTFIRGQGKTVQEAEQDAYNKLLKYKACSGHEFEKRGYENGLGFCKHCNLSKSGAFAPWETCVDCNKLTYAERLSDNSIVCPDCYDKIDIDSDRLTDGQKRMKKSMLEFASWKDGLGEDDED